MSPARPPDDPGNENPAGQGGALRTDETSGKVSVFRAKIKRRLLRSLRALVSNATDSEGRKVVPHGEWEGLFASANRRVSKDDANVEVVPHFAFGSDTARNYIQYAKKHPEPITKLSDAEGKVGK